MAKKNVTDIEREAISVVKAELSAWESATAFITDKVAFNMRNLIRELRKNYWGIFDEVYDANTGKKKIWVPLTETLVEDVVKNIDIDQKDLRFRALLPRAYATTQVIRAAVKNYLDKIQFGEKLDVMERVMSIDGTSVWKTYTNEKGKLKVSQVDLLNFYIDPLAENIQVTPAVIERSVISVSAAKKYDWINTEELTGSKGVHPTDNELRVVDRGETDFVDIYERWGLAPKYLITGNKKDTEQVEMRIVVSDAMNNAKVHKIELNTNKDKAGDIIKPYEEAWYRKVPGRWYGRGIVEMVLMLQLWINTVVNIRINRAQVAQLGIFKIKTGAGITPKMLSGLTASGAISVNDMNDIEQLQMQEASQASYKDEEIINMWGQKVTSAHDISSGQSMPASMPATNAVLQDKGAKSSFEMVKEGMGSFLIRWMDRHALPIIAKTLKKKVVIRLVGEDVLKELSERIVAKLAMDELDVTTTVP